MRERRSPKTESVYDGLVSLPLDAEMDDRDLKERTLFYVAATRAKREVVVTSFGRKSKFV